MLLNDAPTQDDETQALLMQDFEVGQTLQQNIIPKAVLYFTGEALEGGDEDDDDVSMLDVTAILAAMGIFMVYVLY